MDRNVVKCEYPVASPSRPRLGQSTSNGECIRGLDHTYLLQEFDEPQEILNRFVSYYVVTNASAIAQAKTAAPAE
jgi:hypothetical protein